MRQSAPFLPSSVWLTGLCLSSGFASFSIFFVFQQNLFKRAPVLNNEQLIFIPITAVISFCYLWYQKDCIKQHWVLCSTVVAAIKLSLVSGVVGLLLPSAAWHRSLPSSVGCTCLYWCVAVAQQWPQHESVWQNLGLVSASLALSLASAGAEDHRAHHSFQRNWCRCARVRKNRLWCSSVLLYICLFFQYLTGVTGRWWGDPVVVIFIFLIKTAFNSLCSPKTTARIESVGKLEVFLSQLHRTCLVCPEQIPAERAVLWCLLVHCDLWPNWIAWAVSHLGTDTTGCLEFSSWGFTGKNADTRVGFCVLKFLWWADVIETISAANVNCTAGTNITLHLLSYSSVISCLCHAWRR